jgi:predicted transcriptional regulator
MALKQSLSRLEQEVMDVLWSHGHATAAAVQAALAPQRTLKDSTVRTLLTRLEAKGYVRHTLDGRTFVYSTVQPRTSVAVRAVKQIIDRLCHGSVESLLVGMVDNEVLAPEELRRIAGQLARRGKGRIRRQADHEE